jgi:aspartate/methionine/tyrosine aminotransferase
MMGWRVGYIAYPGQQLLQQQEGLEQYNLGEQLLKVCKRQNRPRQHGMLLQR